MTYHSEFVLNEFQLIVFRVFGEHITRIDKLNADASDRNLFRIFTDNRSVIGVKNKHIKENLAFINFSEAFIKAGLKVPEVYSVSEDGKIYIEEDLGDTTLFNFSKTAARDECMSYYMKALSDLLDFQLRGINVVDLNYCYQTESFSNELIYSDFQKFQEYYITKIKKSEIDETLFNDVNKILCSINSITDNNFFLYRDFQTRNIMINNGELYYIDYQSGRRGPLHYDAASFLYSGSIDLSDDERSILLSYYIDAVSSRTGADKGKFIFEFYYFVLMRLIQILGSYGYTYEKKKDESVLKKIPKAISNIRSLRSKTSDPVMLKFIDYLTG